MLSVHEEYILERTKDVCQGGVDVAIDFVSSPRTMSRVRKVLNEVGTRYSTANGVIATKCVELRKAESMLQSR